ncbi:MAG TPA: recombinase family protein [Gemmataceae bacterium]|nr:recombinase family protein [Gemmataceae bacterium]
MKRIVIYTRFSSDMQRQESCSDQEREVRAGLRQMGIDTTDALVLKDEAESGTKINRDGFARLTEMIRRGEVSILAVDDQSRLSRANNACAFIQDLVFHGGRFISTGEGIDTFQKGWKLRVQVLGIHNSATIEDLAHRVHRGQKGRVLEDGSAGDFPFGYESFFLNPEEALRASRRGPKPKKGLRVCEEQAKWVRQIFAWFVAGVSIRVIARRLNEAKVPKDHRSSKPGWHHQLVRAMLANEKYVGVWRWAETTTIRDSAGRKKQIPTPLHEQQRRDRPQLRIIDQETWDKASKRLAELNETFGIKEGQKSRGPKVHPPDVYPSSLLGGLLVCGCCGAKLWQHHSNKRRYYACPNHNKGLCAMASHVPADQAEQALTGYLTTLLCAWPDWLTAVYQRVHQLLREEAAQVPQETEQKRERLQEVTRQLDNLVAALADGSLQSMTVKDRLHTLEREAAELREWLERTQTTAQQGLELPDQDWLAERLCQWVQDLNGDVSQAARVLRQALGTLAAHAVIPPGKQRGYTQLRFRIQGWQTLCAVLGDRVPGGLQIQPPEIQAETSPEFRLDLGQRSKLDQWAPQIATWRSEGVTWEEIVARTGLDLNRAFIAWKRYTQAQRGKPNKE